MHALLAALLLAAADPNTQAAAQPAPVAQLVAAPVAQLVAAPVAQLDDAALDARIAEAHKLPFLQRVEALSALFVGVPYGEFPLGDGDRGPEAGPLWRTDKVDCQTYVETVLAMANASSLGEARRVLTDLRYADGTPSFESRNHFTEAQWLPANQQKGYLREATQRVDRRAPKETLVLRRAEWEQVPGLQRLAKAKIPEGEFALRYLPLAEAQKKADQLVPGSVIFVVRERDPKRVVRVTHMGFVVQTPKGRFVRHAALGAPHAVTDEELHAFLARQESFKSWKVAGVALALPLDASRRVARLASTP